jgi:hypothetical protein
LAAVKRTTVQMSTFHFSRRYVFTECSFQACASYNRYIYYIRSIMKSILLAKQKPFPSLSVFLSMRHYAQPVVLNISHRDMFISSSVFQEHVLMLLFESPSEHILSRFITKATACSGNLVLNCTEILIECHQLEKAKKRSVFFLDKFATRNVQCNNSERQQRVHIRIGQIAIKRQTFDLFNDTDPSYKGRNTMTVTEV